LLKEILRKVTVVPGYDIVFIARIKAVDVSYQEMEKSVRQLLKRANVLKMD
jgi:ribonuclease P protein component